MRSLQAGIKAFIHDPDTRPSQKVLTQSVMARNHVPRTVAGIPFALAMTGRCDILAGHAAAAWTRKPDAGALLFYNQMR